jgi:hypothetical protein
MVQPACPAGDSARLYGWAQKNLNCGGIEAMQLLDALRNSVQRLQADLEDSRLLSHCGDRGEFRERIIEEFLRPYLPRCYGVGSGEVFSVDGASSRQLDIVLFDTVFSNVLFRDKQNSLFPCESVYGVIEVKSNLTSGELDSAIQNISSLKRLRREATDMLDILPLRRLKVGPGLGYSRTKRNPYMGVIFAYDGLLAQSAEDNLNGRLASPENPQTLPDFIFNLKKGYMGLRMRGSGNEATPARLGGEYERFVFVPVGGDTLPLFFLTINVCLNLLMLRAPDLNQYWMQVFKEAHAKAR